MFDAVEMTAYQMVLDGTANAQDAPEKAAEMLLANKYHEIETDDTYRIPKPGVFGGGAADPDKIRRVLDDIRRNPERFNYDPPMSRFGLDVEMTGEMAAGDRREKSYWVTDGNELGVVLMDLDMAPITKNGEVVRLSWDEIEAHTTPLTQLGRRTQRKRRGSVTATQQQGETTRARGGR
jgi:hypothetical protein